jgi:hypothetical protein
LLRTQACISVINIILGVGMLSMPYAMSLSGTSGVAAIALCCLLFCTSGKFISWGLDLLPPGAHHSYPELGEAAFGRPGRKLVAVAAAAELFGGSCMQVIILWRCLEVRKSTRPRCIDGPSLHFYFNSLRFPFFHVSAQYVYMACMSGVLTVHKD